MISARKTFHFDFERGTVARSQAQPVLARLKLWLLVHVCRDDLVRTWVSVRHVTHDLIRQQIRTGVHVRERCWRLFTLLHQQPLVIDRATVETWRCACEIQCKLIMQIALFGHSASYQSSIDRVRIELISTCCSDP